MTSFTRLALLIGIAGTLGCGYHLAGHGNSASFIPSDVHRIGMPPFKNETDQPQLEQRVSESLADELSRRGRFEALPGVAGADAVLEGTISSYRTQPVSFSKRGVFDRVEVTITARVRLYRTGAKEETLWSQNQFVFRQQYDLPETPSAQSERDLVAIDEIAQGFARSIVTTLLEGF